MIDQWGECEDCSRKLGWLEGPYCDPCMDASELSQGRDPLAYFRDDGALEEYRATARESGIVTPGKDRLAIDLVTRRVVYRRSA